MTTLYEEGGLLHKEILELVKKREDYVIRVKGQASAWLTEITHDTRRRFNLKTLGQVRVNFNVPSHRDLSYNTLIKDIIFVFHLDNQQLHFTTCGSNPIKVSIVDPLDGEVETPIMVIHQNYRGDLFDAISLAAIALHAPVLENMALYVRQLSHIMEIMEGACFSEMILHVRERWEIYLTTDWCQRKKNVRTILLAHRAAGNGPFYLIPPQLIRRICQIALRD
jgi:hypothetical protein